MIRLLDLAGDTLAFATFFTVAFATVCIGTLV